MGTQIIDYYEFLQISPHADAETVHRVYRFLAARLHPDNRATGNADNFRLLKAAYDVLSDPRRRAEYDATRNDSSSQPLSTTIDFMDSLEGELNRRLAVLAVLYSRRRMSPNFPEVPLAEIEERMGFPRDYLDFTLWYLQKKGYIAKADNAQYTLTVDGVDFVETERGKLPTLHKLLTSGSGSSVEDLERTWRNGAAGDPANHSRQAVETSFRLDKHAGHSAFVSHADDRRAGRPDRRVGAPDLREKKVERRFNARDRRAAALRPDSA
jgi:curved DNA-binding protein